MMIALCIVLFILGAVFGSFWWVIVERGREWFSWQSRGEVFGGRSYCPWCDGKLLVRWQLIPLLWRLIQKGKCFRCKSSIPWWYCWIELFMWAVFVATWVRILGDVSLFLVEPLLWVQLWLRCLINRALVLIILADLQYYELNVYLWIILLVLSLINLGVTYGWVFDNYVPMIYGTALLTGLFVLIYKGAKRYATKKLWTEAEWFGEGDVMMAFSIGLLLPPVFAVMNSVDWIVGIQWLFMYLVLSSVIGILYWAGRRVITGNDDWFLPFLPAMIVAYWVMIAGSGLLNMMFVGI